MSPQAVLKGPMPCLAVGTWLELLLWPVMAVNLKVMMIHNSHERNAGWREGFDFFLSQLQLEREPLETLFCEEDFRTDAMSKVQACASWRA